MKIKLSQSDLKSSIYEFFALVLCNVINAQHIAIAFQVIKLPRLYKLLLGNTKHYE